ncbi:MAG: potassium channel family protein [Shimia sp.]
MRLVIVGASRFGIATARQAQEAGHSIVLVDRDREALEGLEDTLDCGRIHGDGAMPDVLRDAYGDGADALLLLTNSDDVNVLAALVGRSVGFERVIVQIIRPELSRVCAELGLDDRITPFTTVARSIVHMLDGPDDEAGGGAIEGAERVLIDVGAPLAGRRLGKVDLPAGARIAAALREASDDWLDDDATLREGDRLIVFARPDARQAVIDALDPT